MVIAWVGGPALGFASSQSGGGRAVEAASQAIERSRAPAQSSPSDRVG